MAWNTPATREEAQRLRHRHILGCSRGVGIRLVRDGAQHALSTSELAALLAGWVSGLADRSRPLPAIDDHLIRVLGISQPNAGLGAHIAARTGEPRHG